MNPMLEEVRVKIFVESIRKFSLSLFPNDFVRER